MTGSESTIGALLDETGGSIKTGPFGTKLKASEYTATGVPVISVGEVGFGRLRVHHDTPRVDDTVSSRMPEYLLKAGDIVFGRKGAVERSAQVQPDEDGYFLGSDGIRIRLNVEECDPKFISYQLQTTAHRSWMIQHAAGTTMPSLNEGIIRRIPIVLKPLAEQKAIAAVLGALDDKIELNRRMNAKLEEMARALFQSWFVDFDPVRAKMDGREPVGLDPAIAALFPDSFQDSEAGHIPKGWTVRPLSSHACYLSRGIGPSYLEQGGVCVLNQKCVRDHRVDLSKSRRHDSAKKPIKGRVLQLYDVLVNSTGMGTLGRLAQVFHLPEEAIVDSHVTVVRAAADTDAFFLGISLTDRETEIEELGEGSTGQTELSRARLGELRIIAPPFDLQKAFGVSVGPLLMRMTENEMESRSLATLRDTLLPKLLSGELSAAKIH